MDVCILYNNVYVHVAETKISIKIFIALKIRQIILQSLYTYAGVCMPIMHTQVCTHTLILMHNSQIHMRSVFVCVCGCFQLTS